MKAIIPAGGLPMPFEQLLLAGESQTLEFKSSFDKATVESLVAFANAQGGTILVGVSDAGVLPGVTLGKETLNECWEDVAICQLAKIVVKVTGLSGNLVFGTCKPGGTPPEH